MVYCKLNPRLGALLLLLICPFGFEGLKKVCLVVAPSYGAIVFNLFSWSSSYGAIVKWKVLFYKEREVVPWEWYGK